MVLSVEKCVYVATNNGIGAFGCAVVNIIESSRILATISKLENPVVIKILEII